jgi:Flp pilus assembly protein TadG
MRNPDPRPSARPTSTARPRRAGSPRSAPGQALVETAIGIVLLMLLTFSVVDAAMLFFAYLTLQNGVTAATRFGVTGQDPNDDDHPTRHEDSIRRVMRNATPGLTLENGEFTFYNITTQSSGTGGPNDIIQVTVTHPLSLISPMVWPLVGNGGVITLRVSATMRNEPSPDG